VKVGTFFVLRLRVLPFGEGKTNEVPAAIDRREAGESEYPPETDRPEASSARFPSANCLAESSFHRYGRTEAPFETATSTAVEKDRTSTMTTTSLTGARLNNP
jgi:hypothetical protein